MEVYSTFFDRKLSVIDRPDLESIFGIKLDDHVDRVIVYPELTSSVCSCRKQNTGEITSDINNFKIINDINDSENCIICQSKMDTTANIVGSHGCTHYYHHECIQKWLETNSRCPICNTDWKFTSVTESTISVCFADKTVIFDTGATSSDVCAHFGVDQTKYKLSKNGNYVDTVTDGFYGLCTADMHVALSCIEVSLVNSIKSETKKIHTKSSTKIKELKNDVALVFGMMLDNIILIHNGIELGPELDDLNLFNIGIINESFITIVPNTNPKFRVAVDNNFVVIYADSELNSDSIDPVRKILAGKRSWNPSAYVSNISDYDISCLLSSLYVLIKTIDKNEQLIQNVVSKFGTYLELYNQDLVVYNIHTVSKTAMGLLLKLDNDFGNKHRTILSASIYELIHKMKEVSGCGSNSAILSESNVLCSLLLDTSDAEMINWAYARKNMAVQKTFVVYSPLSLNKLYPPVLTVDSNSMIAVYVGKNKNVESPITLYQPFTDTENSTNPAVLIKNIRQDIFISDDRVIDEAIMICIDTSNSMDSCSDFEEDLDAKKKAKSDTIQNHYKVWDSAETSKNIIEADIRALKNAVIWFITHPNLSNWKKRYGVLRQIVCLENQDNSVIAASISKYRSIFSTLWDNKSVKIDGINYTSSLSKKTYDNIPSDYLCPISLDIMLDPVVLDDGFTYDRKEIKRWFKQSRLSPMTNEKVSEKMIPNKTLKSAINSWIEKQPKPNDIQHPDAQHPDGHTIQIIRENEDSLYYAYQADSNIYDLIYYLYNTHHMSSSDYILSDTSGFSFTMMNKSKELSKMNNRIVLKKNNPMDKIKIKIIYGHAEHEHGTETIDMPKKSNLKNVIYASKTKYDYDKCKAYINLKPSGDNMYTGSIISYNNPFTEDTTIHIFNELSSRSGGSKNYFSRLDIVKKLFDAFINRSIAYGFNTAVGLMSFNNTCQLVCPITSLYENFRDNLNDLETNGGTALYDCVSDAITHLVDWKKPTKDLDDSEKKSESKLRIICLSDGADTSNVSRDKKIEIKSMLKEHSITLDCIVIGDDYDTELISMSSGTNGYMFNPSSIARGFDVMELETLITSVNRKTMTYYRPINDQTIPPMLKPKKLKDDTFSINNLATTTSKSDVILKELTKIIKNPHPDIDIYVNEADITFWKIIFSGPDSTPYANGCWLAYIQFPPSYPLVAPEIRMVTPIKHCNINNYGRICHSILDRNYISNISISTILECVYGLLLNPDVTDPLDTNLALKYYEATGEYEADIMKHVNKYANKTREAWKSELNQ